jgi:hypothetical protein
MYIYYHLNKIKNTLLSRSEMSIAIEKLPLPHRDVRKKKLPRRDGFQKNVTNFTAATVLDQKYWY